MEAVLSVADAKKLKGTIDISLPRGKIPINNMAWIKDLSPRENLTLKSRHP